VTEIGLVTSFNIKSVKWSLLLQPLYGINDCVHMCNWLRQCCINFWW